MKAVFAFLLLGAALASSTSSDGVLNFVIMGDWGGTDGWPYTTGTELEVATQMGKKAAEIGSQFTVALGDNFYGYGVKNVDDTRFQATFEVELGDWGRGVCVCVCVCVCPTLLNLRYLQSISAPFCSITLVC